LPSLPLPSDAKRMRFQPGVVEAREGAIT